MNNNKFWVGLALTTVAAGAFFFYRRVPEQSPATPASTAVAPASTASAPLKIGAILPLTGDAAQYGNNDREGIELAVALFNDAGGVNGRKIEVVYEDCQTDAKRGVSAFAKLRTENIHAVIDNAISSISLALAPQLAPNQTVLISTGASNPSLSGVSPFFFRIWNSDAYEGQVAADYFKKTDSNGRLAIFYINSEYGKGLEEVLARELAGSKVQIVFTESYEKTSRDFRSQIAKLKAANPTQVYLIGYAAQTGPAIRQIRESGLQIPVIGTVAMEDAEFLKLAGEASEGVIYPFPRAPAGEAVERFTQAFKARYNKAPGLLHDCGYDAANLLLAAFKAGATNGEEVRKHLAQLRGYAGASGEITFDAKGDVNKPMEMKVVQGGAFKALAGAR